MPVPYETPVRLAVLNPGGRDPYQDFSSGPDVYDSSVHAPINFHAYAAATCGAFFDSAQEVIRRRDEFSAAMVLIRRRAWLSLEAVRQLKKAGIKVVVTWKECSHNQVSRQLRSYRALLAYGQILHLADGILSPTLAWPPRTGGLDLETFLAKLKFIPTPYPIDFEGWNYSRPIEERNGIMIGTREFKTESRNHIQAVARAASLAHLHGVERVTVVNTEGRAGLATLRELSKSFPAGSFQIVQRRLPYPDYMNLLSSHRLVFQLDRSTVPGQVAGDSLLARTVCAGGSSTIERIAFPEFCDDGTILLERVYERINEVLNDDDALGSAIAVSQAAAQRTLSFEASARLFAEWEVLK